MNWDAAGAIGEMIGAIAVVVSLIYLAVQIRNGATSTRAAIRNEIATSTQNLLFQLQTKSHLIVKLSGGEEISAEERTELSIFHRAVFRNYENYVYQHSLGMFDESEWRGSMAAIRDHFSQQVVQEDWRTYRHQFSSGLQTVIDPLVPHLHDQNKRAPHIYAGPQETSSSAI